MSMSSMPSARVPHESPAAAGLSIEHLECKLDVTYNWGYEETRKELRDLYEKAKRSQWLPDTTLPWDTDVDLSQPQFPDEVHPLFGSPMLAKLTKAEHEQLH